MEKGLLLYKKLPDIYKTYNVKLFRQGVKDYIKANLPPDKVVIHSNYV